MGISLSCLVANYHEPMTYLAIIMTNADAMLDLARFLVDVSKTDNKFSFRTR